VAGGPGSRGEAAGRPGPARRQDRQPRLGYQQLLRYLDGDCTLDEAHAETVTATKRFARRQESWFRRDPRVHWLNAADPQDRLLDQALHHLKSAGLP